MSAYPPQYPGDPNRPTPTDGPPPMPGPVGYGTPQYPPSANQPVTSEGGFFAALFDFSFTQMVTPKIVKFVYVLATIGLALTYVVFVIAAFTKNGGLGIVVLLIGAVGTLVYLAFIRMTLEFYFSVVRMSQDINQRLPHM